MVLDAGYVVVAANWACAALLGPQVAGGSFVQDAPADPATAQTIVNWPEVACAGLDRLRQDARRSPSAPELRSMTSLAEAVLDGASRPSPAEDGLMVCPWFRIGSTVVRTIAMTARFDHIAEVTLDELRIGLMYLMDDDAGRFFRAHDSQAAYHPRRSGSGIGYQQQARRATPRAPAHPREQPKCRPLAVVPPGVRAPGSCHLR